MAKDDELRMDEFDAWDDQLDSFNLDDFDSEFGDSKSRKPMSKVRKGLTSIVKGFGKNLIPNLGKDISRKMPKTKSLVDEGKNIYDSAKYLKNQFQQDITPGLISFKKAGKAYESKAKSILPKRLHSTLDKMLETPTEHRGVNPEEERENSISTQLSEIFKAQAAHTDEIEKDEKIERLVDRQVTASRHDELVSILKTLKNNAVYQAEFSKLTHSAYMKKSLELKYRSLFLQQDTLKNLVTTSKMMEAKLDQIRHNTSLPDIQKQTMSESYKESARAAMMNRLNDQFGNWISGAKGRAEAKLKEFASGFNTMGGMAEMAADMSDMMPSTSPIEVLGGMVGGALSAQVSKTLTQHMLGKKSYDSPGFLEKQIKKILPKDLATKIFPEGEMKGKLTPFANMMEAGAGGAKYNTMLKTLELKDKYAFNPFLGPLLDILAPDISRNPSNISSRYKSPFDAVSWDQGSRLSLTEVIPGFLSKIERNTRILTGDPNAEELVFDTAKRDFSSASRYRKDMTSRMFGDTKNRDETLSKAIGTLRGGFSKVEGSTQAFDIYEEDLRRLMVNLATRKRRIRVDLIQEYIDEGDVEYEDQEYITDLTKGLVAPTETLRIFLRAYTSTDAGAEVYMASQLTDSLRELAENDAYKTHLTDVVDQGNARYLKGLLTMKGSSGEVSEEAIAQLLLQRNSQGRSIGLETGQKEITELLDKHYEDIIASGLSMDDVISVAKVVGRQDFGGVISKFANKFEDLENSKIAKFGKDKISSFSKEYEEKMRKQQEAKAAYLAKQRIDNPDEGDIDDILNDGTYSTSSQAGSSNIDLKPKEKAFISKVGSAIANVFSSDEAVSSLGSLDSSEIGVGMSDLSTTISKVHSSLEEHRTVQNRVPSLLEKIVENTQNIFEQQKALITTSTITVANTGGILEHSLSTVGRALPKAFSSIFSGLGTASSFVGSKAMEGIAYLTSKLPDLWSGGSYLLGKAAELSSGFFGALGSGAMRRARGVRDWWVGAEEGEYDEYKQASSTFKLDMDFQTFKKYKNVVLDKFGELQDLYIKDRIEPGNPLVTKKQLASAIDEDGNRIETLFDIKGPIFDPETKNTLITQDDLDAGLVTIEGRELPSLPKFLKKHMESGKQKMKDMFGGMKDFLLEKGASLFAEGNEEEGIEEGSLRKYARGLNKRSRGMLGKGFDLIKDNFGIFQKKTGLFGGDKEERVNRSAIKSLVTTRLDAIYKILSGGKDFTPPKLESSGVSEESIDLGGTTTPTSTGSSGSLSPSNNTPSTKSETISPSGVTKAGSGGDGGFGGYAMYDNWESAYNTGRSSPTPSTSSSNETYQKKEEQETKALKAKEEESEQDQERKTTFNLLRSIAENTGESAKGTLSSIPFLGPMAGGIGMIAKMAIPALMAMVGAMNIDFTNLFGDNILTKGINTYFDAAGGISDMLGGGLVGNMAGFWAANKGLGLITKHVVKPVAAKTTGLLGKGLWGVIKQVPKLFSKKGLLAAAGAGAAWLFGKDAFAGDGNTPIPGGDTGGIGMTEAAGGAALLYGGKKAAQAYAARKAGQAAVNTAGKKIASEAVEATLKKKAAGLVLKKAFKGLGKALPAVGVIFSACEAADYLDQGDWLGAGMAMGAGICALLPGLGTVASIGLTIANIIKDVNKMYTDAGYEPLFDVKGFVTDIVTSVAEQLGLKGAMSSDDPLLKQIGSALYDAGAAIVDGVVWVGDKAFEGAKNVGSAISEGASSAWDWITGDDEEKKKKEEEERRKKHQEKVKEQQKKQEDDINKNREKYEKEREANIEKMKNMGDQLLGVSDKKQQASNFISNVGNMFSDLGNGMSPSELQAKYGNSQNTNGGTSTVTPEQEASFLANLSKANYKAQDPNAKLGQLSARFESGNLGTEAIGYDSTGGTSYGKYQIASKVGTFEKFLKWLEGKDATAKEIAKMLRASGNPNTGSKSGGVPDMWRKIAKQSNALSVLEHEFIKESHYEAALKGLPQPIQQMVNSDKIMQDVLWSTAVQHGAGGARDLYKSVWKEGMTNEEFLRKLYSLRGTRFGNSTPKVRASVLDRFKHELGTALASLGASPGVEENPEVGKDLGGASTAAANQQNGGDTTATAPTDPSTGATTATPTDMTSSSGSGSTGASGPSSPTTSSGGSGSPGSSTSSASSGGGYSDSGSSSSTTPPTSSNSFDDTNMVSVLNKILLALDPLGTLNDIKENTKGATAQGSPSRTGGSTSSGNASRNSGRQPDQPKVNVQRELSTS